MPTRNRSLPALLPLAFAAFAGCGTAPVPNDVTPVSAGSCHFPASGGGESCVDFLAGYTASSGRALCAMGTTNTYQPTPCTATGRVGRCTLSSPGGAMTQQMSYYAPTTTAQAMSMCAGTGGTFAAD